MLDLFTIGDIKLDTFIMLPEASVMCGLKDAGCKLCLDYGAKIPVDHTSSQIAGSAPNVAVGIARMGKKSAVVSLMGKDITHTLAVEFLKKNNVETRYVKAAASRSSSFAAVLTFRGESTQLAVHGNADYTLPTPPPKAAWMHIAELGKGYERLYREIIAYAKANDVRISFNPGEVQLRERKKELLALINTSEVLFVNRKEAATLLEVAPSTAIPSLLKKLYTLGADDVVITDGKNGAYAYDGKTMYYTPVFPGKRIEATGAGDAFASGYIGALIHERTTKEALCWGSVNAVSVIGSIGPTDGLLSHKTIIDRLAKRQSYKTQIL